MAGSRDVSREPNLEPSLQFDTFRGMRYPNQFFDLSQQYMPPTIKELFRWCTFYYYNSPLIGSAIKKVSRYPITDLIVEDPRESVRNIWEDILVDKLKMKDRLMEVNLDYHVYGNAFVSIHQPFTRFLQCSHCKYSAPIKSWDYTFKTPESPFHGNCPECTKGGHLNVKDKPYKDKGGIRLIRWNPENIHIKYNEYTGRYIYMYSVPGKLKNAIYRGDKDILEDTPLIILEALKRRRMIRFNPEGLFHLKQPTLAEQDQGWGKPNIIHVLKDQFYFYTLRRAQEAIALEHIVPFDILYPLPNAQQDPYIHTDLGDWKAQIEDQVQKHRRDPNFKGVIPVPVGFGRLGGDGKALLLAPETDYLTRTIAGGLGIPSDFLFGGLQWSGSSISLRTLENDFIQNRTQLIELVNWIKRKLRAWYQLPDCKSVRLSDFRMADDVQKNQQLIGLNAAGKVSNETMLTELGYDYESETKKIMQELFLQNYMQQLMIKSQAKAEGESTIIQFNYQQRLQEMADKAQEEARKKMEAEGGPMGDPAMQMAEADQIMAQQAMPPQEGEEQMPPGQEQMPPGQEQMPPGQEQAPQGEGVTTQEGAVEAPADPGQAPPNVEQLGQSEFDFKIDQWTMQLLQMDEFQARQTIADIKGKLPEVGSAIESAYNVAIAGMPPGGEEEQGAGGGQAAEDDILDPAMQPMPEQAPPRRMDQSGA